MSRWVLLIGFVLAGCGGSSKGAAPSAVAGQYQPVRGGIAPGDLAPQSTVVTEAGARELSDMWKDGVVLLVFYRGHWCPTCRAQLERMQKRIDDLERAGFHIVAISADKPADAAALKQRLGLTYDVLGDPELGVIRAWQVVDDTARIAKPAAFIIANGEVVFRHVGKNPADHPT